MQFYELLFTDASSWSSDMILCRSEDLNVVKHRHLSILRDGPNRFGGFYNIKEYRLEPNRNGTISRYERDVWGYRENGPMFEGTARSGFFDYRGEKLTDDQKSVLEIILKNRSWKFLD